MIASKECAACGGAGGEQIGPTSFSWADCGACHGTGITPDCVCGHEDCDWLHNGGQLREAMRAMRAAREEEMRGRDLAKARLEAGLRARRAS